MILLLVLLFFLIRFRQIILISREIPTEDFTDDARHCRRCAHLELSRKIYNSFVVILEGVMFCYFFLSSELMPPPLPPAIMPPLCSIDPKHFDRRASSRSCEQRSTNVDGYCTHSRMNDDNSCAKCGRQSSTKNYCNHSQRAADSNCLKCGSADVSPSVVSHRTVASCGKCDSYRETGNCTGRCKHKPRSRSDLCSDEPCCSKDDNSAGTPGPTINVPRDERGRKLNDIVQPIKSHRLKATRQETEKFVVSFLLFLSFLF